VVMNSIKSQKGAAMIVALIAVMVLSFLGAALWMYSVTDTIQVDRDKKLAQAYYIARSGADATADYILRNPDALTPQVMAEYIEELNGKESRDTIFGGGTFTVKVDKTEISSGVHEITITSTGTIGDTTNTAKLTVEQFLTNTTTLVGGLENAIFSTGDIVVKGNSIVNGSIEANGTITTNGSITIKGAQSQGSLKVYPAIAPPDNKATNTSAYNWTINNKEDKTIDSSMDLYDVYVKSGGTLTFDLSKGNLTVSIHELNLEGNINIIPSSTTNILNLFINTGITGNTGCFNVTKDKSVIPTNVFVYLPPYSESPLAGYFDVEAFSGILYAPGAQVKLHGGATFLGAMVVGQIESDKGTPVITYYPGASTINVGDLEVNKSTTVNFKKGVWK
jgi:hypothetical protein